jgi:chemotaxis protein methyltransferase CheR
LGLASFEAYLAYLVSPAGKGEVGEMINVVTTNLTSFFRESHHFEDMVEVLTNRGGAAPSAGSPRRIRIWASACSTGEEPYSVAIAALQGGLVTSETDLRILATDLDTDALNRATDALYPVQRLKTCPAGYRQSYFDDLPKERVKVKDKVKRLISFNQLNLHDSWPVNGPFDVIFCRNVMIYFADEAKRAIVARFVKLLRPGGTLYLGHSESMLGSHPELQNLGQTIFRKKHSC